MSKQSEKVKRWRKSCKARIIEAMGGSCCVCGYNKCQASLAMHHLDPKLKDFGFGKVMANPQNWASLIEELRKCVLVCNNCHGEIHDGSASVPLNAPRFNETFSSYKDLEKVEEVLSPCPVCKKMKRAFLKNCSLDCARRSKYKVDWDNINLIEELKTKSIVKLAEEIGCSDGAIHKRLRKLRLK